MAKIARKIFQPTPLSAKLIEMVCDKTGANLSDYINYAIENSFLPHTESLKRETLYIFQRLKKEENIPPEELKACLARCVESLKNHPVKDYRPLEQVFIHFTYKKGRNLRYDYIQIVDSKQDQILRHLNEVLKTLDSDYTLGTHEFGERSRYVFDHWTDLYRYSEVYVALATLIECENIYYPLDEYRTLELIKSLDNSISDEVTPILDPYKTNLTLSDKYHGIRYEINVYLADNAYAALSGDNSFRDMSQEISNFEKKYIVEYPNPDHITEDDLKEITTAMKKGELLFRRLSKGDDSHET